MIVSLCRRRHDFPKECKKSIFPTRIENVKDIPSLFRRVHKVLKGTRKVDLYVSGHPVALTIVIEYCLYNHKKLVIHHYDRESHSYYEHRIGEFPISSL